MKRLSLPEVNQSIPLSTQGGAWRRFLSFAGPAFMVSVGYMDPGNWGTDLAAGSQFGYKLLWVILLSNVIAQFLQILCVRLGLVSGYDLAMGCRAEYPRPVSYVLWILCELAIIACDLAEVVGSAVALNLLFRIPLTAGVLITGFDVLILLGLMNFGFRKIEAVTGTMVLTVAICFAYQIFISGPDWAAVGQGLVVPSLPGPQALEISLGILGATVMPHNLYLHSSIAQTRIREEGEGGLKEAIKYNTWDTVIALSFAFFVNAAILILAAATFHVGGHVVSDLTEGHKLLGSLLGGASATAFAVALLASGQSSTLTGTLAGQIVMEGFVEWRVEPWVRRILTRTLAIVPAIWAVSQFGGQSTIKLLVVSQIVLSFQLPFAIFPLIHFTSSEKLMGAYKNSLAVKVIGYSVATIIFLLNVYLLREVFKNGF